MKLGKNIINFLGGNYFILMKDWELPQLVGEGNCIGIPFIKSPHQIDNIDLRCGKGKVCGSQKAILCYAFSDLHCSIFSLNRCQGGLSELFGAFVHCYKKDIVWPVILSPVMFMLCLFNQCCIPLLTLEGGLWDISLHWRNHPDFAYKGSSLP